MLHCDSSGFGCQSGRYHPDRNPAGRDQFQAVAQAYERLQAGAAGGQGAQTWRLLLLLKVLGSALACMHPSAAWQIFCIGLSAPGYICGMIVPHGPRMAPGHTALMLGNASLLEHFSSADSRCCTLDLQQTSHIRVHYMFCARWLLRCVHWVLQAQCILFRRYPGVLEPFKYAGYPLLLQTVTLPDADADSDNAQGQKAAPKPSQAHWLAAENVPQLQVLLPSVIC